MPYTEKIKTVAEALKEVFTGLDAWFDHPQDERSRPPVDGGWNRERRGAHCTARMSVRNLGKIGMYQWLYILAMHARRHLTQIGRTAASFSSFEATP